MKRAKKPHVVKMRLADGSIREYVYAYRGGPRIDGIADPQAVEKIRIHQQVAAHRLIDIGRKREVAAFLEGEESSALRRLASKLARNAKTRAKKRGLAFNLSTEGIYGLLRSQGLLCAVSGIPFDLHANEDKAYTRNPYAPSIDRIDNRKGYTTDNVRLVLVVCNFALNEWGEEIFKTIASAVVERPALAGQRA